MTEVAGDPRSALSIPDGVTWLNTAYLGPLPNSAVEAGWCALDRKAQPWLTVAEDFFLPTEQLRGLVAGLIATDAEGVAVTPAVSYGVSTFAANVGLTAGSVVVVPRAEFPSGLLAWRARAEAVGAEVVEVDPDGSDPTGPMLATIAAHGERVAVVSAPPCHWTDGTRFDLVAIGEAARAVGAALIVDVSQSLGAEPFSVDEVRPDVVVGVLYKWLLGPPSMAFAWFAPRWRDGDPLEHSWMGREGADDFAGLTEPSARFRGGARRFDAGQSGHLGQMAVALAALRLVSDWDPARTAVHARALTDRIAAGATDLGFAVAPAAARAPHLIGLGLDATGLDPAALAARLADDRVHVSVRGTSVRVSAHRFNDDGDVDRLLASLARAVGR